ncbi:MAG: glycosyltransferase family 2 protein [Gemmobacter sp.]|nr:glycosyltransferase family 2 protein [Gemmobacter sp.]
MASPRWGVAATVKAPPEQVLAFTAHHLDLGANRVWLHFDDPEDQTADIMSDRNRVTVVRCDDAYWKGLSGHRPPTHQVRQMRNITRICRRAQMDWIAHLDVDEFLLTARPIPDILADLPPDQLVLRAEPYEALYNPDLPDDIFTARHFRRGLGSPDPDRAAQLFGRFGALLPKGMLSHTVGKCFFRTRVEGMVANIHGARIGGERVFGGQFHPDLSLLHFHAEDPTRWLANLRFRLSKGAYQFLPDMQAHLLAADDQEIAAFYDAVQLATPRTLTTLQDMGLLRTADLGLRAKIGRIFPNLT